MHNSLNHFQINTLVKSGSGSNGIYKKANYHGKKNRYESQKAIRKKQGGSPKRYDYDKFPYASTKQEGDSFNIEIIEQEQNI